MTKFVTILSLLLFFICGSNCIEFCDVKTFDNVFNIGHLIYMTRCGELWTFDPRMNGEKGGFIRDYAWFSFARNSFGQRIANSKGMYNNSLLHFAAFSFQELECDDWWFELERDCQYSAQQWNTLSVIADNYTAITFRYDVEIIWRNDSNNPLGFSATQDTWGKPRLPFWPDISKLAPEYEFKGLGRIRSALFHKEEYRLFLVFVSPDQKFYCITHLNMRSMLFDVRFWPKNTANKTAYDWAPPFCFTGYVAGMFSKDGVAYIVGRVLYHSREYEDQVYPMTAADDSQVDFGVVNIPGYDHPHNLRTFFGCDVDEQYRSGQSPLTTTTMTTVKRAQSKPDSRRGGQQKSRSKRSAQESKPMIQLIWDDMCREIKEDWVLLCLMAITSLIMIYIISRLKK